MIRRVHAAVAAVCLSACALQTSGLLPEWQGGGPSGTAGGGPLADAGSPLRLGGGAVGDGATSRGTTDSGVHLSGPADATTSPATVGSALPTPGDGGTPEGGVPDAGTVAGDAAGSPESSSAVFGCGAQLQCILAAQTCCMTPGQGSGRGGGSSTIACEDGGACSDPTATALRCTATADCAAGEVCCLTSQSSAAASHCAARCGSSDVQLCDPSAPGSGCTGRAACTTSQGGGGSGQVPSGVGTCG